jgi:hypothetical protein
VHLGNLGFANVVNPCEDFYKVIAERRVPPHDVLVTNPPCETPLLALARSPPARLPTQAHKSASGYASTRITANGLTRRGLMAGLGRTSVRE